MSHIPEGEEDKFADTKGVVRSRRSKTGTDSTMTKKKRKSTKGPTTIYKPLYMI